MGDVVNLRQFRKVRQRKESERQADANRLTFGRTKLEREMSQTERDRNAQRLDGHKLEVPDPAKDE